MNSEYKRYTEELNLHEQFKSHGWKDPFMKYDSGVYWFLIGATPFSLYIQANDSCTFVQEMWNGVVLIKIVVGAKCGSFR